MKGHGTQFGRKKEEAIAALLTQRNLDEAAKSFGIAPNTLLKWMKQPEFEAAYREARRVLPFGNRSPGCNRLPAP
jgi:transposase-like protein